MLKNRSIPFGYCVINGKYTLNKTEAEAVKSIFEQYINGKSLKTIASEMQIPYNSGKSVWNKNMICRVLENRKYLGESGFPKIISDEDFEQAAQIKLSRRTTDCTVRRCDNNEADKPQIIQMVYEPTEEIERMISEINQTLESEITDKDIALEKIIRCAQLKYSAIKEVIK